MLLEMDAYMQACTLYGAGKLEGMQQAVHIQQLLHMSHRDLKCLFDRIEMKHQLHLTILVPVAVDCRQPPRSNLLQTSQPHCKLQ